MTELQYNIVFGCICLFITITLTSISMEIIIWFFRKRHSKKELLKQNEKLKKEIDNLKWLLETNSR